MKKILFCLPSLSLTNGIATFIMEQYEKNIEEGIHFDFLLVKNLIDENFKKRIEKNGGNIFVLPSTSKLNRFKKVYNYLKGNIFISNKYDIVHVNLIDFFALACILASKKYCKKIIYHVHNPQFDTSFLFVRKILNYFSIKNSDLLFACSQNAGDSMFKDKKYTIINNLIDFEKFEFNEEFRWEKRNELGINEDQIVVGVVGRITDQKNPMKVIEIFNDLNKLSDKYVLVWIGDGDLKSEIIDYVNKNYIKNINFIGEKDKYDINKYYSSFDMFLLPSKYEGMGIVFIEAQANGLLTFASNEVPNCVAESSNIFFSDLSMMSNQWANFIKDKIDNQKKYDRKDLNKFFITKSKFSIKNENNILFNYYKDLGDK